MAWQQRSLTYALLDDQELERLFVTTKQLVNDHQGRTHEEHQALVLMECELLVERALRREDVYQRERAPSSRAARL